MPLLSPTGRKRKEDGKPCVTSETIILFEITLRQTSLSFKQMFLLSLRGRRWKGKGKGIRAPKFKFPLPLPLLTAATQASFC